MKNAEEYVLVTELSSYDPESQFGIEKRIFTLHVSELPGYLAAHRGKIPFDVHTIGPEIISELIEKRLDGGENGLEAKASTKEL